MKKIIFIFLALLLGCTSDDEMKRKEIIEYAKQVSQMSWSNGLPVDDLSASYLLCKNADIECPAIFHQMQEIADGIASCNDKSNMCNSISDYANSKTPFIKRLPQHRSIIKLPTHPFYFKIGNIFLDSQAQRGNYRAEIFSRWWTTWQKFIVLSAAFVAVFSFLFSIIIVNFKRPSRNEKPINPPEKIIVGIMEEPLEEISYIDDQAENELAREEHELQQRLITDDDIDAKIEESIFLENERKKIDDARKQEEIRNELAQAVASAFKKK